MKRVLVILEDMSRTGSTLTMLHIIESLKNKAVVDVFVCTSKRNANVERLTKYNDLCSIVLFGNLPHSMSSRFKSFYWFYIGKLKHKIRQLFRDKKYDYVIGHNYFTNGPVFRYIKKKYDSKLVFYSLGKITSVSKRNAIKNKELKSRQFISEYCFKFLAISSNCFDNDYRCDEKEVVLHDFPTIEQKTINKRFSNCNKIVVGQIGYFDKNKNQLFSLEIIKTLRDLGVDCRLYFLGFASAISRNYYNSILDYIKVNHLDDFVSFFDSDFDKMSFFDLIDIMVLPSFSEGYGLTILESLCRKTPVICSEAVPEEMNYCGIFKIPLSKSNEWIEFLKSERYKKDIVFDNKLESNFVADIDKIFY